MEQNNNGTTKKFSASKTPLTGKQGALVVLGVLALIIVLVILVGSSEENGGGENINVSFLSFVCSKPINGHTAYYYLKTSHYFPRNTSFPLSQKITDVTVYVSTISEGAGWDTNFLCNPKSAFDLSPNQWRILTAGSDCGLGAKVSPCDVNFVSDEEGVSGIIIAPEINGYTSKSINDYFKKGVLLKVTGKPTTR